MASLEDRVSSLEKGSKNNDAWEKVRVLGSLLVPLAIGLTGYFFARSNTNAQLRSSEFLAERGRELQLEQTRIEQAKLVSTFLEALVSDNVPRRKVAIRALLIALPNDGPELVRVVSASETDTVIRTFAVSSLRERRTELVEAMFGDSAHIRKRAVQDLLDGWRTHSDLIPPMLGFARDSAQRTNQTGVYNTVYVLSEMDPRALQPHRPLIEEFLREAEKNGRQTAQMANKVRIRLGASNATP